MIVYFRWSIYRIFAFNYKSQFFSPKIYDTNTFTERNEDDYIIITTHRRPTYPVKNRKRTCKYILYTIFEEDENAEI